MDMPFKQGLATQLGAEMHLHAIDLVMVVHMHC